MGIPYVEAPCEAESQCAALAKAGKVCVQFFYLKKFKYFFIKISIYMKV